jgi:hypothetical protein
MTDPLPPPKSIFVLNFEGAPVHFEMTRDEMRDYLADVLEDGADSYSIWRVYRSGRPGEEITSRFCREWAKCFDLGSGDDRETILAPIPQFIRAFIGDKLIADYRAAQEAA